MKNFLLVISVVCLLPLLANSQTQVFTINDSITSDEVLYPFSQNTSYGLDINGKIYLNSDSSMARVILYSLYNNEVIEYLVCEVNKLLAPTGDSVLTNASEETCYLNNAALDSIK